MLIDFREGGREGERERKGSVDVSDVRGKHPLFGCLLYAP